MKSKIFKLATIIFFVNLLFAFTKNNQRTTMLKTDNNKQPIELGKVNWLRKMDLAIAESTKTNKPILILFQEVPGCMTCQRYGTLTLSHPLIVETIESYFVPLAIYNNKKGQDAKVLKYYGEPAWNNPVVRIVNTDKSMLTNRLAADYSPKGLVDNMIQALNKKNIAIPIYLQLLQEELQAKSNGTEKATLAMHCFWEGEKEIGKLAGVLSTKAGFMGGKEVVQIEYDPLQISYENLLNKAQKADCASAAFIQNENQKEIAIELLGEKQVANKKKFRLDKDPKYYLSKTIYQYIPMTELQAAKINALIGDRQSAEKILSKRQLDLFNYLQKNKQHQLKSAIGKDIVIAWADVEQLKF
ncbi:MAG TPA: hypothetical protein ENK52_04285 [Saprospiraceae bacterium]|nr:hypothetical protein [Saprospiraceae bacterium]